MSRRLDGLWVGGAMAGEVLDYCGGDVAEIDVAVLGFASEDAEPLRGNTPDRRGS